MRHAYFVRRLSSVRAELVDEAIWGVLRIACVIGVDSHWAIEVDRGVRLGHEWTIHWNLMEIHTNAMVLSVAVEEHAELQERVG